MSEEFLENAPLFEEENWEEIKPKRRFMRSPLLMLLLLLGASFLLFKTLPKALHFFDGSPLEECGELSDRPHLRRNNPELPPLAHQRYCQLSGTVDTFSILATGEVQESLSPYKRHEHRRYFVKLAGDKVFLILAGDRRDVVNYRDRQNSLLGFSIKEPGRILDPDQMPGYEHTSRTLRLKYSLPESQAIRLFDTTDHPHDYWPYLLICFLMALTIALALFSLFRFTWLRLRTES